MKLITGILLAASTLTFLSGCANQGWTYYRAASKCHFEQKGPECNEYYEKAIEENDKLPGLHSSYGVHLIETGDNETGQSLIQEEIKRFPESEASFRPLLNPGSMSSYNTPSNTSTNIEQSQSIEPPRSDNIQDVETSEEAVSNEGAE